MYCGCVKCDHHVHVNYLRRLSIQTDLVIASPRRVIASDKRVTRKIIFSAVMVYDPPPTFAVKTALWLLKPEARDWTRFRILAFGTFGSRVMRQKITKNNYFLQFENTFVLKETDERESPQEA